MTVRSKKWNAKERAKIEEYLTARGWVRLVERADVWINVRAPGEYVHDVYTFRAAYAWECTQEQIRRHTAKKIARRAIHVRENPDTPEAEEWRESLTHDLESALEETTNRAQRPEGLPCDTDT